MKNLVIIMNCHGAEIARYLNCNKCFLKDFNVNYMPLNYYVDINKCKTNFEDHHIKVISEADVLILQIIEKDRGFLNNSEVIKYCKKDCHIIKIPHYRNSIYNYKTLENKNDKFNLIKNWNLPKKIQDINNIDETKKIIQNEIEQMNNFTYDKNDMLESMNLKIDEFIKIDSLSDIKMLDHYNNNYKKQRLFMGRSYPSSIFFFELTNRILIKLNYNPNTDFIDYHFAENTGEPIPDYWYTFCNFLFDHKKYYTYRNIEITECEWYYILLLSGKPNIAIVNDNLNYLKKIRGSQNL